MNATIQRVSELIDLCSDLWFERSKTSFNSDLLEKIPQDDELSRLTTQLFHANAEIWQYSSAFHSTPPDLALLALHKSVEWNKKRNELIERLDQIFCSMQKGMGAIQTETVGSALDRLIIYRLKYVHLEREEKEGDLRRSFDVRSQYSILLNSLSELMDDMEGGKRCCLVFSRYKIGM